MTKREKLVQALTKKGLKQVKSRSSKYTVFQNGNRFYFVGRNGALRVNNKNTASSSHSITHLAEKLIEGI